LPTKAEREKHYQREVRDNGRRRDYREVDMEFYPGKLIVLEGIDGSGKSTQAKLLAEYLRGIVATPIIQVREPGGTVVGETIRGMLVNPPGGKIEPMTELLMFGAARSQLVREVIRPGLEKGVVVICDRFVDSTMVYQGYGAGLSLPVIKQVNLIATCGIEPDLIIWIDINEETGRSRVNRRDGIDAEKQHRISHGYHQIYNREKSGKRHRIDGVKPLDEVAKDIQNVVILSLQKWGIAPVN
jgi:dTMP kinase